MPRKKKVPEAIETAVSETFERVPLQKCREFLGEIKEVVNFKMNQIGLLFDDLSFREQGTLRSEIGSIGVSLTERAIALITKELKEAINEEKTENAEGSVCTPADDLP